PSILIVGGHIHAIKDTRAAPQHGVGGKLVGETEAGRKIISIHSRVAVTRGGEHTRPDDVPNLSKLGEFSGSIPSHRNADAGRAGKVAELKPVVAFAVGCAPLVA